MFDSKDLEQSIFIVSKQLSIFPLISTRTHSLQQRVRNVGELLLWHFTFCSHITFPENEEYCNEFVIDFPSVTSEV